MQADLGQSGTGSPSNSLTPGSPTQGSRKRKATSTGSRGVATLTPEQLAKKRANDREAQRAIRERTKQTIEGLERRIRDLESQQPYQELQVVIRQKDAVQAENEEIRRRLTNILAIIQPVVGAQGLTGETYPDHDETAQALTLQDLASAAHHNVHAGLAQPANAFQQEQYMNGQHRSYPDSSTLPQGQNTQYPFSQDGQNTDNRAWHTSRDALEHQRDNLQRGLELNDSGERVSFNFLLDSLGQRGANLPGHQSGSQTSPSRSTYPSINTYPGNSEPIWTQLPKNIEPTCPLDSILLNFYHSRRSTSASNSPKLPPSYPSVSSLLNPSSAHHVDPLSQLMTDIISKFPNISALPEQAAVLLFMFTYMRWQIEPTEANFSRVPDWARPTETQLYTPHPAWVDHLPFPRMRDKIVNNYQDYPFENWFIPFTSGMSVNWPYEPTDCLLKMPSAGAEDEDEAVLNPVFERHIRRLENWSVGPAFLEAFPSMEGTCTVRIPMARDGRRSGD